LPFQIDLFGQCIFRLNDPHKKDYKLQESSGRFAIQRAQVLFPPDENGRDDATLYQFVERQLGTDGMLYLYERELLLINDELEGLDYKGIGIAFDKIESDLANITREIGSLSEKEQLFNTRVSIQFAELQEAVAKCEPRYNAADYFCNYDNSDSDDEELTSPHLQR
jgi:hypothetical protein